MCRQTYSTRPNFCWSQHPMFTFTSSALVWLMASYHTADKPLPGPMISQSIDTYMRHQDLITEYFTAYCGDGVSMCRRISDSVVAQNAQGYMMMSQDLPMGALFSTKIALPLAVRIAISPQIAVVMQGLVKEYARDCFLPFWHSCVPWMKYHTMGFFTIKMSRHLNKLWS